MENTTHLAYDKALRHTNTIRKIQLTFRAWRLCGQWILHSDWWKLS